MIHKNIVSDKFGLTTLIPQAGFRANIDIFVPRTLPVNFRNVPTMCKSFKEPEAWEINTKPGIFPTVLASTQSVAA